MRIQAIAACLFLTAVALVVPGAGASTDAAPDCTVQPTWPSGYVGCQYGPVAAGCHESTGALVTQDGITVACGVAPCPVASCVVGVRVVGVQEVVDAVEDAVGDAVGPVLLPASGPASAPASAPTSAPASDAAPCDAHAGRWVSLDCATGLPCSYGGIHRSVGRLSAHYDGCTVGAHLDG